MPPNYNLTQREERLLKILEMYKDQIIFVHQYLNVYSFLVDNADSYSAEINIAPAFFMTSARSIRTSTILQFTKLFDDREKNSLNKLLNICKSHLRLFTKEAKARRINADLNDFCILHSPVINSETIEHHRDRLHTFEPTLQKLKFLRDKYHAHFDNIRQELIQDNQFTLSELETMKDFAGEIVNFYRTALIANHYMLNPANSLDIEDLLKILKNHNRRFEAH